MDEWPPATPPGYRRYDPTGRRGDGLAPARSVRIGLFVAAFGATAALTAFWLLEKRPPPADPVALAGLVGLWVVETAVHEAIHAAVARGFGFPTTAGIERVGYELSPYVHPHGAFQTRGETVAFLLAPASLLAPVGLGLLIVGDGWLAAGALAVLVSTVVGSVGDLGAAWRVARLPPGTLQHNGPTPGGRVRFYRPADGTSATRPRSAEWPAEWESLDDADERP
jgi:hypothetical protein